MNLRSCMGVFAMSALFGACAIDEDEPDLGTDSSEVLSANALANNALANNALTNNALANNALANNALANNGLITASAVNSALCSTDTTTRTLARSFFSYMTGCALPLGTSIAVQCTNGQSNQTFYGALGLAPNWRTSAPTTADQEVVTSCLGARVNTAQNIIALSLRGSGNALAISGAEGTMFPVKEGAFYGNLFTPTPKVFGCGATLNAGTSVGRGCGWGGCSPIVSKWSCSQACTTSTNGYYTTCWDGTTSYTVPITVYLTAIDPLISG